MFRLGWQVFRERLDEALDPTLLRRAAWLAGSIAAVALVLFVAADLASGWAGPGVARPVLAIAFATAAVGAVSFACFPTARPVGPELRINGRQVRPDQQLSVRSSVKPYLQRRAQPVPPEARDDVLNDVPLLQRGLVRRLARLGPLLIGIAFAGLAVFVARQWEIFVVLWPFVYLLTLPEMVVELGRAERARLAARDTASSMPEHRPPWRRLSWRRRSHESKVEDVR